METNIRKNLGGFFRKSVFWGRAFLLAFFCCLFSFQISFSQSPSNDQNQFTEEEKRWIAEHSTVRFSNYATWAPIDFFEQGKPTGFSIEYIRLIASKIGIEAEFITSQNWANIVQMNQERRIDVIHSLFDSEARNPGTIYTQPYLSLSLAYYGRIGAEPITNIEGFNNKRIGVVEGWSSSRFLIKNYPRLDFIEYPTINDALNALSAGFIDVFVDRMPSSNYVISKNFITGVEFIGHNILPYVDEDTHVKFAVRDDWPLLVSILEKGMRMITSEEYLTISEKWEAEYDRGGDIYLTLEEHEWLKENSVFRVSADPNAIPIIFRNDSGELDGLSWDILQEIANRLNITFVPTNDKSWNESFERIKVGNADVIIAVTPTLERSEFLYFTDSHLTSSNMIFALKDGEGYTNLHSLRGKKMAQIKGSFLTDSIAKDYPDIELIIVENNLEALSLLSEGKVDAFTGGISIASNSLAENDFDNIRVTGQVEYKTKNSFGIRKELPLLASAMQKAIRSIDKEQRSDISRKWFSLKVEKINYDLILNIIIASIIIILGILIWAGSLRHEVKRRRLLESELRKSRLEAEHASAAKTAFLANMSLEIRTPLNAIIGFSEVMSSGIFGDVEQRKYKEYLGSIRNSGQYLAAVINDILDLSKLESGKWQVHEMDFELLRTIEGVFNVFREEAKSKNISLKYAVAEEDEEIALYADEKCIKRVIHNLVENAIKFTETGGEVLVSFKRFPDGSIELIVSDNGIGMSAEQLEKVTKPFNQKITYDEESNHGLGLSIADKFIKLHNGVFKLESELSVGTRAIIRLPKHRVLTDD